MRYELGMPNTSTNFGWFPSINEDPDFVGLLLAFSSRDSSQGVLEHVFCDLWESGNINC